MPHSHKDSSIIPTVNQISQIPSIDKYFFKIFSNTVLQFTLGPS
jgi:hypothetical protein